MKNFIISSIIILCSMFAANAQEFATSTVSLGNFVKRMYAAQPFEGVKVIDDYDAAYLICVIKLDPAKYANNESTMNRVASVKAMSEANRFFSGSKITMDLVVKTTEDKDGVSTEIIEKINEHASGYVKQMSSLINFNSEDNKKVFVFFTPAN